MSAPTVFADYIKLPPSIHELITTYSALYGVSEVKLTKVLTCESGLNPGAIGDHGTSFGIAQIHLSAHPEIAKNEALNAPFAIKWTAEQISTGHIGMWSCARILGYIT